MAVGLLLMDVHGEKKRLSCLKACRPWRSARPRATGSPAPRRPSSKTPALASFCRWSPPCAKSDRSWFQAQLSPNSGIYVSWRFIYEFEHRLLDHRPCARSRIDQLEVSCSCYFDQFRIVSALFRSGDIPAADLQRHDVVVVAVQNA